MKLFDDLKAEVVGLEGEIQKFEKGNKAAGTRARKHLQTIKKIAQDMRTEIQNKKGEGA